MQIRIPNTGTKDIWNHGTLLILKLAKSAASCVAPATPAKHNMRVLNKLLKLAKSAASCVAPATPAKHNRWILNKLLKLANAVASCVAPATPAKHNMWILNKLGIKLKLQSLKMGG
jgi:hypothetical protein